jgi:hypothetical protein
VPGQTSWEEARAFFNGRRDISIDGADGAIRLFETQDGEWLRRIHITMPDGSLSVGGAMLLYGRPCAVTVYPQFRKFTLHYPTVSLTTPANQTALSPNTPIITIVYAGFVRLESSSSGICIEQRVPANVEASHFRWKGFGGVSRYAAWLLW